MKFTFARIQIAYFLTSVVILTALVYYAYESKERYDEEIADASFHHEVTKETGIISSGIRDSRGYAYGYSLTADSSFVDKYSAAADTVFLHLKQLKQLGLQSPSLRANVDSLEYYLNKRMDYSEQLIDLRAKKGLNPVVALVSQPYRNLVMESVGKHISAIQQQEVLALKEKEKETEEGLNSYYIALWSLIAFGLVLFIVNFRDITERKEIELALSKSEAFHKGVLSSLSAHIAVVDKNGQIVEVNQAWNAFANENGDTLMLGSGKGSNYFEVCQKAADAGDRIASDALSGMQAVLNNNLPVFYMEYPCHAPDEDRWFAMRVKHFYSDKPMIVVTHLDITDRKLAEEKLQESERNLLSVFDNTSDSIWSVDREHRLVSFNKPFAERFRSFTFRDPIIGEVNTDTVPEMFRPDLKAKYDRALNGEYFTDEEHYIFHGQKHCFWVRYNPIVQQGKVTGIAIFATNITEQKLAEEMLQESERNLSSVFDNTSDSIWSIDREERFVSFNKAFTEEFHFFSKRYPVIGEASLDTVREDFRPTLKAIYSRALNGENLTLEEEYTLEGNTYWYSVRYNPIVKDNEVTGIAVFSSDITKRKLAEDALQQSHEKLRKLTEKVSVAIYQFKMAPDGTMSFPFMSKGIEQILQGVTPEQISNDVSIPFSSVHPEDLPLLMQSIEESRQNLTPWNVDYRNITKTGEIKWFKGSSIPEKKEDGTIIWHGFLEDFTVHRETLQKLDSLTRELQTLFNSIDEVLFSVDMVNYRTTQMSPACEKLYGYPPADFFSDPNLWKKVMHQDDAHILDGAYASMEEGEPFEMEYRIIRKDLEIRWIHASIKPSLDNADKLVRIDGIVRDITLRKKVEDLIKNTNEQLELRVRERTTELLEANTALEAFSYSVSHDLRSPLRTLIGISRMISKEYGRSLRPEVQDLFSHIEITGKRMYVIVEDLLKLARFSKEKLHTSEVNMNELFSTIWKNLQAQSPNNAAIEIDPLPLVKADESMLQQVILNLLSNAIKYSSKKTNPQIKVGYKETEKEFVFYVKDNGTGFDMEFYDRLFTPFQRLHSLQEFEGTGVGLTVAKRIIERHHGEIWAVSKVDEGATFYFTLPIN